MQLLWEKLVSVQVCIQKCLQNLEEIEDSPKYHVQEIYLEDVSADCPYNTFIHEEDGVRDTEPICVFVGSFTFPKKSTKLHDLNLHSVNYFQSRIFATVQINKPYSIKLEVDTEADTSVITTMDLQHLPFPVDIITYHNVLNIYGCGTCFLDVTFMNKTIHTMFNI